jgi:hypothetical protein
MMNVKVEEDSLVDWVWLIGTLLVTTITRMIRGFKKQPCWADLLEIFMNRVKRLPVRPIPPTECCMRYTPLHT